MVFPILGGNSAVGGYSIDNSLRFNDNDSARLTRTPSSATNRKTWTWSGWVKRGNLTTNQELFGAGDGSYNSRTEFWFDTNDRISFIIDRRAIGGTYNGVRTDNVFRDVSAWYHVVFAVDTTQATSSNRVKIYINGTELVLVETYPSPNGFPAQNLDTYVNSTSNHLMGRSNNQSALSPLDGYMAEVNFIDGQALSPTDFGEFSEEGIWKPISYSGSYGTNGFYLDFENSGSLGADQSGNGNNWTPTNLASTDQMLDTPTNNFCTFNPLFKGISASGTYEQGNLKFNHTTNGQWQNAVGNIFASSGKWYAEFVAISGTTTNVMPGIVNADYRAKYFPGDSDSNGYSYVSNTGNKYFNNDGAGLSYGSSWTTGDIIGVAMDLDVGSITFYKNNVSQGVAFTGIADNFWTFGIANANASVMNANFGQDSSFAGNKTRQNNSDSNGKGDFYYAPPSGYLALCTQNLATELSPTIDDGSAYFHTQLYTGTGSTNAVTNDANAGDFKPDWLWIKERNNATNHPIHDSNRGSTKYLHSNLINAEADSSTTVQSFDTNGFTLGTAGSWNGSSDTYVAWQWKANGGTTSSNTDGSITSTVQANTEAGFSIITYAGNSTTGETFGHGLGVSPAMFIIKDRTGSANWVTWNKNLPTNYNVYLNTTDAQFSAGGFAGMGVTSSVIQLPTGGTNSVNTSGQNYVCYVFAEIEGYSKFGKYTGNGSTDGPFVYTGFRPSFVIIKVTNVTDSWWLNDNKRNPYNLVDNQLYPNLSNAEATNRGLDFVSNGFKIRNTSTSHNNSGNNYIYMCFAENPFVSSTGIPVVAR